MKKGLVLLSGGIDSAVTLGWVRNQGWDLSTLTYLFPGRKNSELKALRNLCSAVSVRENYSVRLPFITAPNPKKEGYIPQKNLIFYGVAANLAEKIGADIILGGHHKSDGQLFPDAKGNYLSDLDRLIRSDTRSSKSFKLKFPLLGFSKEKIIHLGLQYRVPFQYTWSCSHDRSKHCWNCISCKERITGFAAAGVSDPLYL